MMNYLGKINSVIRDEFRKLGEFNSLEVNPNFVYSKRLIKMLCKKNFNISSDSKAIHNHLKTKTDLVQLNSEKYKQKLISNIKKNLSKKEFSYYSFEIGEYIDKYIELYIDFDVTNFIEYSLRKIKNGSM